MDQKYIGLQERVEALRVALASGKNEAAAVKRLGFMTQRQFDESVATYRYRRVLELEQS